MRDALPDARDRLRTAIAKEGHSSAVGLYVTFFYVGGSSNPWMKRQTINAVTPDANAAPAVAITIASMAAAIRRLRPITSATAPVNGA